MLFNFTLIPLDQIGPWGSPDDPHLHWFGLTDGEYWLEVGDSKLFEFSSQVQAIHGVGRYCSYYVVRLHEDILEMVPHILEPVPPAFVPYISGESGRAWQATAKAWIEESEEYSDFQWETVLWSGRRKLDNGYITQPANIHFWSDESTVHIEWDNTRRKIDGEPAWSATRGSYQLSREDFLQEVRSFHDRLMEQMRERVKQVIAGQLPAEIKIDLNQLEREHAHRECELKRCFDPPQPPADWEQIREAIRQCEQWHASSPD